MREPGSLARDERGELCLGGASLRDLAETYGTPTYVYDLDAMVREARALREAFGEHPHAIAYAVKANSAGPIVRALHAEGCGADVVSGGELRLALRCGVSPDHIVMSGVGKTDDEIDFALTRGTNGILAVQAESREELARIAARAKTLGRVGRVSLRVNPGLDDIDTHAHIQTGHDEAKFGIAKDEVLECVRELSASLELQGLGGHVGSQFTTTGDYLRAAAVLFDLAREASKVRPLRFVDTGGGFGIDYGAGCPASPADFVRETLALLRSSGLGDLSLHVEPGRSLVGASGVVVAKVIQQKRVGQRSWLMIDAGMNDLVRPALYQARHRIVPVSLVPGLGAPAAARVVGPVCESSDDFGTHELPLSPPPSAVAILDAGAYGYTMASEYNGRGLAAEVFLQGGAVVAHKARPSVDAWAEERAAVGR